MTAVGRALAIAVVGQQHDALSNRQHGVCPGEGLPCGAQQRLVHGHVIASAAGFRRGHLEVPEIDVDAAPVGGQKLAALILKIGGAAAVA